MWLCVFLWKRKITACQTTTFKQLFSTLRCGCSYCCCCSSSGSNVDRQEEIPLSEIPQANSSGNSETDVLVDIRDLWENKKKGYFNGWTVLKDLWKLKPEEHFWKRKPAWIQNIGTALHLRHNRLSRFTHIFATILLFLGLELMDTIMGT